MKEANTIGILLVAGGLLTIIALVLHPANSTDEAVLMTTIADNEAMWSMSHMMLGFGIAFAAAGAALWAFGPSGHGLAGLTRTGLTLFVLGAIVSFPIFALEATAMVDTAVAGDAAAFGTYHTIVMAFEAFMPVVVLGMLATGVGMYLAPTNGVPKWGGAIAALAAVVTGIGGMTDNFTLVQYGMPVFFLVLVWNGMNLWRGAPDAAASASDASA